MMRCQEISCKSVFEWDTEPLARVIPGIVIQDSVVTVRVYY